MRAFPWPVPACLAVLAAPAVAQDSRFTVAPDPEWAVPVELDLGEPTPVESVAFGRQILVREKQVDARGEVPVAWLHSAWTIVDPQGLEGGGEIAIDFDPSYEELALHRVLVHRDGERIDKLDPAQVHVIQREEQLEIRMYLHTLTALMFLEDVRVGDTIEYSCSLRGTNPAFEGRYFDAIPFQDAVPLGLARLRLLWPDSRRLAVRPFGDLPEAETRPGAGFVEHDWRAQDVDAFEPAYDVPGWCVIGPYLELGEFTVWKEVVDWALASYAAQDETSAALVEQARSLAPEDLPLEERVLRLLRFTQQNVRYLAIQLGAGSYVPTSPEQVIARRFGDCKDKALLLVQLLRAIGVTAHPALVNTSLRGKVGNSLPSPRAFDHVIVRIALAPDRVLWVDPTDSTARGPLDGFELPDYGFALCLEPGAAELTPVTRNPACRTKRRIEARFTSKSFTAPATFDLTTTFEGEEADVMRSQLAATNAEQMEDWYRQFYVDSFPSILSAGALEIEDDEESNVVRLREHYTIPGFWTRDGEAEPRYSDVPASELGGLLPRPDSEEREHPLALPHPIDVRYTIRVELPPDCAPLEPHRESFEDPWVRYRMEARPGKDSLTLEYELATKADHVPPGGVARYRKGLDTIDATSNYHLLEGGDDLTPLFAILAAGGAWGLCMLGVAGTALLVRAAAPRGQGQSAAWLERPWFTIWFRPRATVLRALEKPGIADALSIMALVGIVNSLDRFCLKSAGDDLSLWILLAIGAFAGPIAGIIGLYIQTGILWLSGRVLGGTADAFRLQKAIAYPQLITICAGVLWIPSLLLLGGEIFTEETPRIDASLWRGAYLIWWGMIQITALVWSVVALVNTLSVAHAFPRWKALLSIALPFFALLCLAATCFGIFAVARS